MTHSLASDAARDAAIQRNPMPPSPLLYHYTGRIDFDNLLKIIAAELFYFSNPEHFNDALDMNMPVTATKAGELNPSFNIIAGSPARPQNAFEHDPQITTFLARALPALQDKDRGKVRTFCTTEMNNHALMWSHYGNRHHGICFGLDWKHIGPPHKVHYQDEFSLSEFSVGRFEWEADPRARIKTTDWAYEEEWRFFRLARNEDELCFIPLRGALKTITLGCKVSRETRKLVYSLVNRYNPSIEIRQIDIVDGRFKSHVLPMPENFNHLTPQFIRDAISSAKKACLESGDVDELVRSCLSYLFHLDELGDSAIEHWHLLVASAHVTRDVVLKNRVEHWCPAQFKSRLSDFQSADWSKASDEIDVWIAYFTYLRPVEHPNISMIKSLNDIDDIRPMPLQSRKLFLTIGWQVANTIKDKSPSKESLISLCNSNLKMAKKINADDGFDIDECKEMLANISP